METDHFILLQIDAKSRLDNYIYILHCKETGITAAIDPTYAQPVLDAMTTYGWTLDYVLNTHHHWDHTDGNAELKERTGCSIIGNARDAKRIPEIDQGVSEGDIIAVGNLQAQILDIPGHTLGHIAFYFAQHALLFSGDTLFSMGCGRMFEGTPEQMVNSFAKLTSLPDDTLICAAHEYSDSNAAFALTIEPNNPDLQQRANEVKILRNKAQSTVPTTIALEKLINPFLRTESIEIRNTLAMQSANNYEVFAELRKRKDNF